MNHNQNSHVTSAKMNSKQERYTLPAKYNHELLLGFAFLFKFKYDLNRKAQKHSKTFPGNISGGDCYKQKLLISEHLKFKKNSKPRHLVRMF